MSLVSSMPSQLPGEPRNNPEFQALSFPMKLHTMLEDATKYGFTDIVTWQAGGKSFKVVDPNRFANIIMRAYFNHTKYKSFQRQLNIYGFRRIHSGPSKGGYTHRCFIPGSPEISHLILRRSNHKKGGPGPETESPSSSIGFFDAIGSFHLQAEEAELFNDMLKETVGKDAFDAPPLGAVVEGDENAARMQTDPRHVRSATEVSMSDLLHILDKVAPKGFEEETEIPEISSMGLTTIASSPIGMPVGSPLGMTIGGFPEKTPSSQHHKRQSTEFSMGELLSILENRGNKEEEEEDEETSENNVFPFKLHKMLDDAPKNNYADIVSWVQNGTAFKVHDADRFVTEVMPTYFDQTKYESFRRQLNLYGFIRVSRGKDRAICSHPYFVEHDISLCRNITRRNKSQAPSA